MQINFRKLPGVSPYHDTSTQFIGVTTNADVADDYAAAERAVIRVHPERWPKDINRLKKKIRYVYKEVGARNFLAVLLEGTVL